MPKLATLSLALWLVVPCVACDQATKAIAKQTLTAGREVALLDGVVLLHLAENPGGFLSLGATLPDWVRLSIFYVAMPVGLLLLAWGVTRDGTLTRRGVFGLSLVVGGGIGNLLDRVFNDGAVVDFVSIGLGGLRTGIFNVSDVAILVGVALLLLGMADEPEPSPLEASDSGGSQGDVP